MPPVTGSSLDILTENGRLIFGRENPDGTSSGNELSVMATGDDPPAVRLISGYGGGGKVSFDFLAPNAPSMDFVQELCRIQGTLAEDDKAAMGGQLQIWCRRKNATGDEASRLAGVISVAWSEDGEPHVLWIPNLGKWTQGPVVDAPVQPSHPQPVFAPGDFAALQAYYGFASGDVDAFSAVPQRMTWAQVIAEMERRAKPQ